jgi:hypothetical protein
MMRAINQSLWLIKKSKIFTISQRGMLRIDLK